MKTQKKKFTLQIILASYLSCLYNGYSRKIYNVKKIIVLHIKVG